MKQVLLCMTSVHREKVNLNKSSFIQCIIIIFLEWTKEICSFYLPIPNYIYISNFLNILIIIFIYHTNIDFINNNIFIMLKLYIKRLFSLRILLFPSWKVTYMGARESELYYIHRIVVKQREITKWLIYRVGCI